MQGTDVEISKKKNFPFFYGSLRSKIKGKTNFFFRTVSCTPFGSAVDPKKALENRF